MTTEQLLKQWIDIAEERGRLIRSMKNQALALGLQVVTDSKGIWLRRKKDDASD